MAGVTHKVLVQQGCYRQQTLLLFLMSSSLNYEVLHTVLACRMFIFGQHTSCASYWDYVYKLASVYKCGFVTGTERSEVCRLI